jgi:hypothetical protein
VVPEQIHTYLCAEPGDQVTDATIALSLFQYPGCIIPICISVTVSTARRGFAASTSTPCEAWLGFDTDSGTAFWAGKHPEPGSQELRNLPSGHRFRARSGRESGLRIGIGSGRGSADQNTPDSGTDHSAKRQAPRIGTACTPLSPGVLRTPLWRWEPTEPEPRSPVAE